MYTLMVYEVPSVAIWPGRPLAANGVCAQHLQQKEGSRFTQGLDLPDLFINIHGHSHNGSGLCPHHFGS